MDKTEKISELLKRLGIELSADRAGKLAELVGDDFADKLSGKLDKLEKQLGEVNERYAAISGQLAERENDFAAERLLSEYRFASERVRSSVLAEVKSKGFGLADGELVGGREFLEELRVKEPDVFAREPQGLFMGSTQGNVSADADNLETQIFGGFGLTD